MGVINVTATIYWKMLLMLLWYVNGIYNLKSSHAKDTWLLLSTSKYESAKLWDVNIATYVTIDAIHTAYLDYVLHLAWYPLETQSTSCVVDIPVKLW